MPATLTLTRYVKLPSFSDPNGIYLSSEVREYLVTLGDADFSRAVFPLEFRIFTVTFSISLLDVTVPFIEKLWPSIRLSGHKGESILMDVDLD